MDKIVLGHAAAPRLLEQVNRDAGHVVPVPAVVPAAGPASHGSGPVLLREQRTVPRRPAGRYRWAGHACGAERFGGRQPDQRASVQAEHRLGIARPRPVARAAREVDVGTNKMIQLSGM